MTMADVKRLFAHWGKYPPARDLLAASIGFETPKDDDDAGAKPQYLDADSFRRMFEATGGRVPGM